MRIIMTEDLIARIDPALLATRGIIVNNNWKNSKPTTLKDLIGTITQTLPGVIWLIDEDGGEPEESPSEIVESVPQAACRAEVPRLDRPCTVMEYPIGAGEPEKEEPAMAAAPDEEDGPAAGTEEEPAPAAAADGSAEEKPAEGGADEPEQPKEEKAQDIPDGFVAYEPKRATKRKTLEDLGKWEEYRRRALTTSEQNKVVKGMTEEGFSIAVIAQVIRTSPQTVCNRRQKMGIVPPEKEAQANGC